MFLNETIQTNSINLNKLLAKLKNMSLLVNFSPNIKSKKADEECLAK